MNFLIVAFILLKSAARLPHRTDRGTGLCRWFRARQLPKERELPFLLRKFIKGKNILKERKSLSIGGDFAVPNSRELLWQGSSEKNCGYHLL